MSSSSEQRERKPQLGPTGEVQPEEGKDEGKDEGILRIQVIWPRTHDNNAFC
jgi:hypothetical protein